MSRKRRAKPHTPANDPLFDIQQAASMTECTGILPAQAETLKEKRNIAELGAIHPPEN